MAVKAREIRELLHNKVDPGVVHVLCALAEENHVLSQQLTEVANHIDKMADLLGHFSTVFNDFRTMQEKLNKKEAHDDLPDHTQ